MHSQAYESFGVRFSISAPKSLGSRLCKRALPPGTRRLLRGGARRRQYRVEVCGDALALSADGVELVRSTDELALVDALEGDLALHVAASAPRHVFVHAGVVAVGGRAILLPGRTYTGKSTWVDRLVAAGATYYSDEYAVIDAQGRVLPYPRPLSLRVEGSRPRRVVVRRRGRRQLPVGWVVGARFAAGHGGLTLQPLTAGRTALLLLDNAVAARVSPERVLGAVRAIAAGAEGYTAERGEARQAARRLLDHCTRGRARGTKPRSE